MSSHREIVWIVPLEAVRIMSGFSEEVAIAVTHPLWPAKDPKKRSDSAIIAEVYAVGTSSLLLERIGK